MKNLVRLYILATLAASCSLDFGSLQGGLLGGTCILNSDCSGSLVCTWGICHVACHTSADCQPGQSCIIDSAQSTVCQGPTPCTYNSDCQTPLICAADLRCRNQCQTSVDCSPGQTCTTTKTCAEPSQVDSNNNLIKPDGGATSGGLGGRADGDAGVRDAPVAQPDVALGGTGGSSGGIGGGGGATSAGGSTTTGGTTGSGGNSGSGGTSGATPPSCSSLAATCGPSGNDDCCTSLLVSGGTFYRSYDGVGFTDKSYPASVSNFYLDKYEITVGRFRQFVNAGMGTQAKPPASSAGARPGITGSGWDSTWNTHLATNTAALTTNLKCSSTYQTWTDAAGSNESKPVNCLDWFTAFAFCAWDGGRLPTEAEWNYTASGGNEQRYYPWSDPPTSTTIGDSHAVYCGGSCNSTQNVGSKSPTGDGKWGQCDLAGNVAEWTLDWYDTYQMPCDNCSDITDASASGRVVRGGNFDRSASDLRLAYRGLSCLPDVNYNDIGARCARTNL